MNSFGQIDSLPKVEQKEKKSKKKKVKVNKYVDTIRLTNNNVMVGELKKMDKSVVTFKTPYSDKDFKIKWHKVAEINSDTYFIVALADGNRFTSTINSVGKEGKVILDVGVNALEEDLINVVFLEPIGKSFLSRLTIDVDFGITMTKTNNLKQLTSNLTATYLANKWNADGFYKTVISRQNDIADVNRMDGKIGAQYFLPNDWFVSANALYLSNDEQKLKLRSTYKAGMGYFITHNNSMYLGASAGLAYTNENYIDDTPTKTSAEMYFGVGFNKYDIGDLSILSGAVLYPSITEKGRYRFDFNYDMKYDLPLDLFIKLSLTYNYDNQPIEGASDTDYVFTTSFGWEFN